MASYRSKFLLFFLFSAVFLAIFFRFLFSGQDDFEDEPHQTYFGPGLAKPDDPRIVPFQVNFTEAQIKELKRRLKTSRIGHKELEDVSDWSYGTRLSELREWARFWAEEYDFGKAQAELNKFDQFRTELMGLKVHFLHVKPPRPSAYARVLPLLLAHGWPGGVYEFYQMIPLLTDPKAHSLESEVAFELVIPSIPGYGFSDQPSKKDFNAIATARLYNQLMKRLGHSKYVAQGGDWGFAIVSNLGRLFPQHLLGIHLNNFLVIPHTSVRHFAMALIGTFFPSLVYSGDREHYPSFSLYPKFAELLEKCGYFHLQATKPDTVGVALNDSPIGLLAYILSIFASSSNPYGVMQEGEMLKNFSRDHVLTLISVYWFQGNILSSQRFYKENAKSGFSEAVYSKYISVPTAYSVFPYEFVNFKQPRELMLLDSNLTQMSIHKEGGHFAALEMPRELAQDVLTFVGGLMAK